MLEYFAVATGAIAAVATTISVVAIRSQAALATKLLDHFERNRSIGESTPVHLAEKRLEIESKALEARLAAQAEQRRRLQTVEGALG